MRSIGWFECFTYDCGDAFGRDAGRMMAVVTARITVRQTPVNKSAEKLIVKICDKQNARGIWYGSMWYIMPNQVRYDYALKVCDSPRQNIPSRMVSPTQYSIGNQ